MAEVWVDIVAVVVVSVVVLAVVDTAAEDSWERSIVAVVRVELLRRGQAVPLAWEDLASFPAGAFRLA